ncbi:putative helicase [Scale drop disease virus]|uniref:ORF_104L n=1 Tax=Scale drop disease virus TaxID=1697349 RepID=A0A0K1L6K9_9VIRU|nr:ORF_104L [Scale drop disease virus]AKU37519.1 ORF_104L [Scale drop disease virus]QLI60777.1 putative helicase [Scale drop disease virus]QXJ13695.1 ORF104L [Scale drop disease virus]UNH60678.1 hypothetical protein SDDV_ORF009 [Scale drop disease virus]
MEVFLSLFPAVDDPHFYPKIQSDSRLNDGLNIDTDLFAQQKFLARFINPGTPYNELLLYHEMGTGKTCTAVTIAETGRKVGTFKGTLVLSRGEGLLKNFQNEILTKCISENVTRNYMTAFYTFETFERFAKWCSKQTDAKLQTQYANHLIVIDEAHNLREGNNAYVQIVRFMSLTTRCKKLLLTGTPMNDTADEIIDVLNLIMPQPLNKHTYFNREGQLRRGKENDFINAIKGRVSYIRAKADEGVLEYIGEPFSNDPTFKIVPLRMRTYQADAYEASYIDDQVVKGVFTNMRKTSLAALPPVAELKQYSVKYHYTLRQLRQARKAFIYCDLIKDTGIDLLMSLLNKLGWKRAKKPQPSSTDAKRYMVITAAEVKQAHKLLKRFNSETNVNGQDVKLVIGSRAVAEGFTLHDVTDVFVLTPHWNFTETFQAIARAWRANSHVNTKRLLGHEPHVRVHIPVACMSVDQPFSTSAQNSIDLHMLELSTRKDSEMKQVEYLLKLAAVDCMFAKARNIRYDQDYSRACQYQPCNYTCVGEDVTIPSKHWLPLDVSPNVDHNCSLGVNLIKWQDVDVPKLWYHWANKRQVTCFSGHSCYIHPSANASDNTPVMSVTLDAWSRGTLIDDGYYLTRLMCKGPRLSISELCARRERRLIPKTIAKVFNGQLPLKSTLSQMNNETQQKILLACIRVTAEQDDWSKSQKCREILHFYRGFWNPETYQVWLFGVNAVLKQGVSGRFYWTSDPDNYGATLKNRLLSSSVGYYGMYNPENDTFCIRDVRGVNPNAPEQDLRRLTVGKRCTDWDQSVLLKLLSTRLIVDVPDMYPDESYEQLKTRVETITQKVRKNSAVYKFSPTNRDEAMRFLYWSQKGVKRPEMCSIIHKWMSDNGLLEHNFECGHHFKHRDIFA